MKKNRIAALFLAALCGVSMAACGDGGNSSGPGGENENKNNVEDPNKTTITVANYDGGIGSVWLDEAAERFATLHKDDHYEQGKTGIYVDVQRASGITMENILNETVNIYISEKKDISSLAQNGEFLDITDIVKDETRVGGSLESAIKSNKLDSLKGNDGKYYGLPHYEFFGGLSYETLETPNLTWTTGDPSVASVENGTVTPVGKGFTTVTASVSVGGKTYASSLDVSVYPYYERSRLAPIAFEQAELGEDCKFNFFSEKKIEYVKIDEEVLNKDSYEVTADGLFVRESSMNGLSLGRHSLWIAEEKDATTSNLYEYPFAVANFAIRSADTLREFIKNVGTTNWGEKGTTPYFVLDADIDCLNEEAFTTSSATFYGTFDGLGHKISNVTLGTGGRGMFGNAIGNTASIFDFSLIGVTVKTGQYGGALTGILYGVVENVFISGTNANTTQAAINNGQDVYFSQFDYRKKGRVIPEIMYIKTPTFSVESGKEFMPVRTVALFNVSEETKSFEINAVELGLSADEYVYTDVWSFKQEQNSVLRVTLKAHESRMFAVNKKQEYSIFDANCKISNAVQRTGIIDFEAGAVGTAEILVSKKVSGVKVNGKETPFEYDNGIVKFTLKDGGKVSLIFQIGNK